MHWAYTFSIIRKIFALRLWGIIQGSIAVAQYQKIIPPEKIEKPGMLKRFLNWIAKGADKSNMGKASCPT
jgi:hypothetical protein